MFSHIAFASSLFKGILVSAKSKSEKLAHIALLILGFDLWSIPLASIPNSAILFFKSEFLSNNRSFALSTLGWYATAYTVSFGFFTLQSYSLCISKNPSLFSRYSSLNEVLDV